MFQLGKLAHEYAGVLSGGQRKLLEFARALMTEPTMLLLDEPMAGINPTLGARLLEHMHQLRAERGMTFLFIEHDMEVVMGHSDKVIVMAEGRVIAQGAAGDGAPRPARDRCLPRRRRCDRVGATGMSENGAILHDRGTWSPATCAEVDILNGVTIDVGEGRDRHGRRPERRRQVDADQDHLRAAEAPQGIDPATRRGDRR